MRVPSSPWRARVEASVVVAVTVHCVEEASKVVHIHWSIIIIFYYHEPTKESDLYGLFLHDRKSPFELLHV